ncbi:hypothetical protein GCM10025779_06070 [Arthrobacter cryoconiti]
MVITEKFNWHDTNLSQPQRLSANHRSPAGQTPDTTVWAESGRTRSEWERRWGYLLRELGW